MRAGLTFLAIALIAALFAAIAAPYFVDWTGQRALIEAAFKRATGIEASFPGAIDLTFLPSPRLRAEKAVLTGGGVSIAADEIEIEASLPRLLGGSPRLNAVRLVAPQIRLGPAPAPNGVVAAISVDALDVSNASIVRVDRAGGEEILVAGADFNGALDSLAGPVSGRFALTGSSLGALTGQVTIGALFKGSAPLQVSVAVPAPKMHVTFTGDVAGVDGWLGDAKRAPTLKGKVEAVGAVDVLAAARAWSANANLSLTAADFALTGLVARLGASGQGLEMQGEAKGRITGAPALSLTLRAKNLDLDRTFHEKAKTAAEPLLVGRELARMAAALGAALVDLDLGADAVTVGGQSLPNAALRWRHDGPVSANVTAKIDMPGSSAAGADGVLTLGASPTFVGKGRFKAEDFARWADWVNAGSAPGDAMRLGAGLGLHGFSAEGDFSASQTEVSGKDLHVLVGGAAFRGPMGWSFASEGAPARLTADLAGARLDLHALPDLSGLRDAMGGVDLALSIQADAVHFARVGEAELGAGGFAVKLQKTADALSIERLSLKDFGGATLEARGAADAKSAHFDGRLDAKSLGDLIALAAQALPSAASPWLAARAGALSPASA